MPILAKNDQHSNNSINYPTVNGKRPKRKRKMREKPLLSVPVANHSEDTFLTKCKQFLFFFGPAVLISVGYVDPGNWATDIEGGSRFGYSLIWVLIMSNMIAIVLQTLAARLGLVTGKDLSQQCSNYYPRYISFVLWILAELAIASTDLAEVLGTAIGLNLLFGLPLIWGVLLTALDTLLFLLLQQFGHRIIEAFIFLLMSIISICFVIEMFIAKPVAKDLIKGLVPSLPPGSIAVATGILGATIMPHNLYLHSGLILTRRSDNKVLIKRYTIFAMLDGLLSLNLALFVNISILVVSAASFYGKRDIVAIQQAYVMLESMFGKGASVVFGISLLLAGQSSTITGTLAGQMVMEGFLKFRMRPWLRRLTTRGIAILPAVIIILIWGDLTGSSLLTWSQVVLSIQLPFAMIPLIRITSHKSMAEFRNGWITWFVGWICVLLVVGLNVWLVVDFFTESLIEQRKWLWGLAFIVFGVLSALLLFVSFCRIEPKEFPFANKYDEENPQPTEVNGSLDEKSLLYSDSGEYSKNNTSA